MQQLTLLRPDSFPCAASILCNNQLEEQTNGDGHAGVLT